MTVHAEEEMDEDGRSIFDVETAILTGTIVQRQKDRRSGQRKYCLQGRTADGIRGVGGVVKFGPTGLLVILTVYAE